MSNLFAEYEPQRRFVEAPPAYASDTQSIAELVQERDGGLASEHRVRHRFVEHLATSIRPPLRGWADDARLEVGAADFLAPLSDRLESCELAEAFFGYCPVAGACADDYRTRLLRLEGYGGVWAGIRFKGGDMGLPFIEVATDFALDDAALARLRPVLADAFALFRPKWLRAWRFEDDGLPPWQDAMLDQTYYAAPLTQVLSREPRGSRPDIRIERAAGLDWYDALAADHAAYLAAHPALADEVRFEAREDLEDCLAAGLLFEAHVAGALAGVMAFEREPFFGLPGFLVREEFLLAPYRGRGLGAWLQRLAAERLPPDHLLFGTIHALNRPSRRTAAACNRVPILSGHFVPLQPPGCKVDRNGV